MEIRNIYFLKKLLVQVFYLVINQIICKKNKYVVKWSDWFDKIDNILRCMR